MKQPALWLVLVMTFTLNMPGFADVVDTIDRGKLGGSVTLSAQDTALTLTDAQGNSSRINFIDIDQVRFNVDIKPEQADLQLLIDNDAGNGQRQRNAKVKLRSGLHRITIPYWQAGGEHKLSVYVSGPGINGRTELDSDLLRCFRNNGDGAKPSLGLDEKGYRLPELDLDTADDRRRMLTRARYRLYASEGNALNGVRSLAGMQLKRSGTTSEMNTGMLNEHNNNVGLVFDAFFVANQDGEYNFTLLSDDGSQFYLGQVRDFDSNSLGEPPVNTPWIAELAHDGQALGELKSIADETMTFHLPLVSDVTIALSHTRAVWLKNTDRKAINRDNEPGNEDTVYLTDKNDPGIIRSVSGKISGLDEANLTFEFRGQERTIARERVVGLVMRHASRPAPQPLGMHQVLELQGGQSLPCTVRRIGEEHVAFELVGGSLATPPRSVVRSMRIENGRRIDLTRITPNAEETVPYFSLKLPHKVNTNFSGKPIMLFDEKTYDRGLAVHSKSRLHYKLKPNCERFQATFGLMNPGGKLGNVTARILGDGNILWEQDNITAETKPINIDLEFKGIERLILEVDFGQGQNVGDRAAWVNPRLIYASSVEDKP